jgi:hypothetical protein
MLPQPTAAIGPRGPNEGKGFQWAIATIILLGAIGIGWDVLAGAILFHSYTFFEAVVVCLLVMILCGVATVRAGESATPFVEPARQKL